MFRLVLSVILSLSFFQDEKTRIVLYGDSITAGYGLDKKYAYPAETQKILQAKGYNIEVVNAGSSGETSAGGLGRINWILKKPADIFLLELGGNDGLRGLPLEQTKKNLQSIIDIVKSKNPDTEIIIAGMMVPPNMGEEYSKEFQQVFSHLAKKNSAHYIPFILEGVGGIQDLNQADGIHPNAKGHQIIAKNVAAVIEPLL